MAVRIGSATFAANVSGNRVDGINSGSGTGILVEAKAFSLIGNITESLAVGVDLTACSGVIVGGYHESNDVSIRASRALVNGLSIQGVFFAEPITDNVDIELGNCIGVVIQGCYFAGVHPTAGAPIRLAAGSVTDSFIGPNRYIDPKMVRVTGGSMPSTITLIEGGSLNHGINPVLAPAKGDVAVGGDLWLANASITPGGAYTAQLATIGGSGPSNSTQWGWKRLRDESGHPIFVPFWR